MVLNKAKLGFNSIVFMKFEIKYRLDDENEYILKTDMTPFEMDIDEPFDDQYDWRTMMVKATGVDVMDLDQDQFQTFKDTLEVMTYYDPDMTMMLN